MGTPDRQNAPPRLNDSYKLDMELPSLGETIRQVLILRESIFLAAKSSPHGIWVALSVVGIAGLSQALGQSLVLFINHVRPRRFILAVAVSVISYMAGYLLWTASVWLVGVYAFDRDVGWVVVATVVGLGYAPQVLAFFELTPFFGSPFGAFLSLWTLVAILIAVQVGLGLETWQAVVTGGLGWLLIQVWRYTLGRPIYALGGWMERVAAGVPIRYRREQVGELRRSPPWAASLDSLRGRRRTHSTPTPESNTKSTLDKDATT